MRVTVIACVALLTTSLTSCSTDCGPPRAQVQDLTTAIDEARTVAHAAEDERLSLERDAAQFDGRFLDGDRVAALSSSYDEQVQLRERLERERSALHAGTPECFV